MVNNKTDNELIKEFLEGSDVSFQILRNRYNKMLISHIVYIYQITEADAEEIVNETFVKFYTSLNNYKFEYKFSTFIYNAVYNRTKSLFKFYKKKFFYSFDEQKLKSKSNFTSDFEKKELMEKLISHLSLKDRIIISHRFYGGLSFNEISEIMNIKVETLRSRNSRAMEKMRKKLEQENLYFEDFE